MTEEIKSKHAVPSDMKQVPIVWRYELLKYLRSRRLLASVALVVLVLALLYALPPALGHPYNGTDTETKLYLQPAMTLPAPPQGSLPAVAGAAVNRSLIDTGSLVVYMNGTEYPSLDGANWYMAKVTLEGRSAYVIYFTHAVFSSSMTATYEWYTSPASFESTFLNFANILVIICATFFGADAIVSEFQNRTGYLMFPNPVRRDVLFFGKFAASMTAGIAVMTLFYGALAALSVLSARGIDSHLLLSFGFAIEYLLATMAVAYLISTVLKGTTGATVLTFFLFMMILPIVDGVSSVVGTKIDGSLTFAAGVITNIMTSPYPTDYSQSFAGGFTIHSFYPAPATAAIVMLAYAVIAVAISLVLFKRKQLVG